METQGLRSVPRALEVQTLGPLCHSAPHTQLPYTDTFSGLDFSFIPGSWDQTSSKLEIELSGPYSPQ